MTANISLKIRTRGVVTLKTEFDPQDGFQIVVVDDGEPVGAIVIAREEHQQKAIACEMAWNEYDKLS